MTNRATRFPPIRLSLFGAGALAFALLVMTASGKGHRNPHHEQTFAALAKVPDKARARLNPLGSDPEAVLAGKMLYMEHCAECHGSTAEGGRKAPSLRSEEVRHATSGTLFWILSNGVVRRGMPDWSRLPVPERWQIVAFLKSLPPAAGAEPGQIGVHKDATRSNSL